MSPLRLVSLLSTLLNEPQGGCCGGGQGFAHTGRLGHRAPWTTAGCPRAILSRAAPQEAGRSAPLTPDQESLPTSGACKDPTTWKVPAGDQLSPGTPGLDAPFAFVTQKVLLFLKKKKGKVTSDRICQVHSPGQSTTGTPERTSQRKTKGRFGGQEGAGKPLTSLPGASGQQPHEPSRKPLRGRHLPHEQSHFRKGVWSQEGPPVTICCLGPSVRPSPKG